MTEETKTPDQLLEEVATKAGVTPTYIIQLVTQSLRDNIDIQEKLIQLSEKQTEESKRRVEYVKKRNEELQALLLNRELEPKWASVIQEMQHSTMPKEVTQPEPPTIPVVQNSLVGADGKPILKITK